MLVALRIDLDFGRSQWRVLHDNIAICVLVIIYVDYIFTLITLSNGAFCVLAMQFPSHISFFIVAIFLNLPSEVISECDNPHKPL